ncbi:peptidoglycan DD-metalloendopeptidase family protein [Acuticoccus sp. I52.16.1]|uniref:peptidoglycan DD-metalloendopeptidase family protein n=1 Tax=Acuticoccus sp. I52.16.1 TaxID=2928472 RepID=UPI001FD4546F|nr:peptidoglycan DD-metalloendopeptidase family protein [Acuticoccus sp. I52.16.1]UOM34711.1 peptidoglycan DD-metalloendopeptidase family protein [Acuticoccus sp. I52.16.1]
MNVPGASLFAANNPPESTGAMPIESRDLAPLSSQQGMASQPITTPASLRQRGWTVEGAPIVEVSPGDTAETLSQGFNVPVDVILEANRLSNPLDIRPGSRVIIPTYVRVDEPTVTPAMGPASIPETPSQLSAQEMALGSPPRTLNQQAAEQRHTVQPGETLYSLARTYNVSHISIATLNGISPDTQVQAGQSLRIPGTGGTQVAAQPAATAPQGDTQLAMLDPQPSAPAEAAPSAPVSQQPAAGAAPQAGATPPAAAQPQADQSSGFGWPLRGAILVGFGKQASGDRNDGINLAAPVGTPVHAAGNGKVIYAGNELEGYGNLVLIQHDGDWVSAYAHNSELKVSRGDTVKKGQAIAAVGSTGSVDKPQLHFELRRSSTPVDPLPHLGTGA